MIDILLQSSTPSEFEIVQVFLIVISLLIPAIVFLVGMFRDETELDGIIGDLAKKNPSSFGKALGRQALSVAIVVLAINLVYIFSSILFEGLITMSITSVSLISGFGILVVLIIMFILISGLSDHGRTGASELNHINEEVDNSILRSKNEQLQNELREQKQQTKNLVMSFRRLKHNLQQRDDMPDQIKEQAEQLVDASRRKNRAESGSESNEEEVEKETNKEFN